MSYEDTIKYIVNHPPKGRFAFTTGDKEADKKIYNFLKTVLVSKDED